MNSKQNFPLGFLGSSYLTAIHKYQQRAAGGIDRLLSI